MKVTGPDGIEYDFPDDVKDEELTSFFAKKPENLTDYVKGTIGNIPSSAANLASGLAEQVKKTATDPLTLIPGSRPVYDAYRNLTGQDTAYKDILNNYKERLSHPLKTIHDDPVGSMLDLAGLGEGVGGALRAGGALAGSEGMASAGKAISPVARLGTPALVTLKGASPMQTMARLAAENPGAAHTVGSVGGLAAGNLIGHPYVGMGMGNAAIKALQRIYQAPIASSEYGLSNVKRARLGPVPPVGEFPEMKGLPPDESSFNPPIEEKSEIQLPVKLPRGKQVYTGPRYLPGNIGGVREALPPSEEPFNPPLKVSAPEPSGDFENRKGTGTKYTPNKEALKGTSGKSFKIRRPVGPPESVEIDPELEDKGETSTGKVNPLSEEQTSEVINRLHTEPVRPTQIKTKSSGRLKKEAEERARVVNSSSKNPTAKQAPEEAEAFRKALEKDPYEIQLEDQ